MTAVLAILAGLAGGVFGFIAASLVSYALFLAMEGSDIDGGIAMGAVFGIGPIGAAVGAILATLLVIRARRNSQPTGFSWQGIVALGSIVTVLAGLYFTFLWEPPSPHFDPHGPKPHLEFEIRVPTARIKTDQFFSVRAEVETYKTFLSLHRGPFMEEEGETTLIRGTFRLYYMVPNRVLNLWIDPKILYLFDLPVAENPDPETEFGPWRRVDRIDHRAETRVVPAGESDEMYLRTRVTWPDGR